MISSTTPTGDYLHDAHVKLDAGLHVPQASPFRALEANVENCLVVLFDPHLGHFISASDEDTSSSNLSLQSKHTNSYNGISLHLYIHHRDNRPGCHTKKCRHFGIAHQRSGHPDIAVNQADRNTGQPSQYKADRQFGKPFT